MQLDSFLAAGSIIGFFGFYGRLLDSFRAMTRILSSFKVKEPETAENVGTLQKQVADARVGIVRYEVATVGFLVASGFIAVGGIFSLISEAVVLALLFTLIAVGIQLKSWLVLARQDADLEASVSELSAIVEKEQGAEISLLTESPIAVDLWITREKSQSPPPNFVERTFFNLKLVFSNTGPKGGALTDLKMEVKGTWSKELLYNVNFEAPSISAYFNLDVMPVTLEEFRAIPVRASVSLTLKDADSSSLKEIIQGQKEIVFGVEYRVSGSGGQIVKRETEIHVIPRKVEVQVR